MPPTIGARSDPAPASSPSTERGPALMVEGDSEFGSSGFGGTATAVDSLPALLRRQKALIVLALVACLGIFMLARWLASQPFLDGQWAATYSGALTLQSSTNPSLARMSGQVVEGLAATQGTGLRRLDASLLHRSPRWQASDDTREELLAQIRALDAELATGQVRLRFVVGEAVVIPIQARGYAGLGWLFWLLAAAALTLFLVGAIVGLAKPLQHNLLFLFLCWCHACNLLIIAIEVLPGLGAPMELMVRDLPLRLTLDACTGAAIVHAFALYPTRLPQARSWAWLLWAAAAVWTGLVSTSKGSGVWWWSQALLLALGLAAWFMAHRSYATEPNPLALAMRRFAVTSVATLVLVSFAISASARVPGLAHGVAVGASVTWYLFLGSLMVLAPFMAGSRGLLRELALLAGISTVAMSLDLMFVSLFSVGPFLSLVVSVFVAALLYGGARKFILQRVLGTRSLSAERIFNILYRAARDLQATPERHAMLMAQLLRDLFDPLKLQRVARVPTRTRVVHGGAALVVPVQAASSGAAGTESPPAHALMLHFAQRGQRLFTNEDARLAEQVIEQLRRAVAYDRAVERGRSEERLRIAQDLHDDIGARLLTLMYQSPTPAMEDYIRHTLQDLKTLTRGLAANDQALSHAAAEWKTDLTQRMTAASSVLVWSFAIDHDPRLSAVQWSAITRILRELVSNALYHGHATQVDVTMDLSGSRLRLRVTDDGIGRTPQSWAHGLGLGGVRKRAKLLGGQVTWSEAPNRGISCLVDIPKFDSTQGH